MSSRLLSFLFVFIFVLCTPVAFAQVQPTVESVSMVSSDPPYICQIQLGLTQKNYKAQIVRGNQGNSISSQNVKAIRSQYCTCLVLAFSEDNFQGRYEVFKIGGYTWKNLEFLSKSLVLSCYPGLDNTAYTPA